MNWISSWEFHHPFLPPPSLTSVSHIRLIDFCCFQVCVALPSGFHSVGPFPGRVPGATSQRCFNVHQPLFGLKEASELWERRKRMSVYLARTQESRLIKSEPFTPWTCPSSTQRVYQCVNLETVCTSLPSAYPFPQKEATGQARCEGRTPI